MHREVRSRVVLLTLALVPVVVAGQEEEGAIVETALVQSMDMTSQLPLNGTVFSRNDAEALLRNKAGTHRKNS